MNVQSIGSLCQNYSNFLQANNVSFKNTYFIRPYNPQKCACDITVFSSVPKMTDIRLCSKLLKEQKISGKPRFTAKEIKALEKTLRNFKTSTPKHLTLTELLYVKSKEGKKLTADDIANFLCVMNDTTKGERKAAITLLQYHMNSGVNSTQELDSNLFIHLENCPKLISKFVNINNNYRSLGENKRGQLMNDTLNIIVASDYRFMNVAGDIAEKLCLDGSGAVSELLLQASTKLSNRKKFGPIIGYLKFKKLLNSLSLDKIEDIQLETAYLTTQEQKAKYFNNYINNVIC